jgi:MYXO-CTERM domain-containing protein
VPRSTRANVALIFMGIFMGIAISLNLILLFAEDTSPGWPIAAVILLGAAGAALLSQRREP